MKPYDIPLGCLVPRETDGLLIAGRSISGSHDAHASYRVQCIAMAFGPQPARRRRLPPKKRIEPRAVEAAEVRQDAGTVAARHDAGSVVNVHELPASEVLLLDFAVRLRLVRRLAETNEEQEAGEQTEADQPGPQQVFDADRLAHTGQLFGQGRMEVEEAAKNTGDRSTGDVARGQETRRGWFPPCGSPRFPPAPWPRDRRFRPWRRRGGGRSSPSTTQRTRPPRKIGVENWIGT